jgi:methionine-rich copper-binding protein CopC
MHNPIPARAAAALATASLLVALGAVPVLAHAALVKSDPADRAVLTTSPTTITLTFDDDLDGSKSNFVLVGPTASSVTGAVTPDNIKVMTAASVALDPGAWTIQWTAFSTDGHLTRGTVRFSISAPTPPPTATPAPTFAPAATVVPNLTPAPAAPTPTPLSSIAPAAASGDDANGTSASTVIAVVAGLAIVAVVAWFVFGRARRS